MQGLNLKEIEPIVQNSLKEDIGNRGDITSKWTVCKDLQAEASIFVRDKGVIAGIGVVKTVFEKVDEKIKFNFSIKDGQKVCPQQRIASVLGPVRSILTGERVALNFLQHMSGIATLTKEYVEAVKGTKAKILDTRKTTPGLRPLEKYAVRVGGGENHRFGLYDMVLIKENHIKAAGGIEKAISKAKKKARISGVKIEVEVKNLKQLKQALSTGAERIMLDNMNPGQILKNMKQVQEYKSKVEIEASGGISLENVREVAKTGVDFISVGALTHSSRALDMTLLIERII